MHYALYNHCTDLQEELCNFVRSYKTIVKSIQPLSENIPHPFNNQISNSNSDTELDEFEQLDKYGFTNNFNNNEDF